MLRCLFKFGRKPKKENRELRTSRQENNTLRTNLVIQVRDESQLVTPGNDLNERYEGQLKYIQRNKQLNRANKEKQQLERISPFVVILKGITNSDQPNDKFLAEVNF